MSTGELFELEADELRLPLGAQAIVLHRFAEPYVSEILDALVGIVEEAPLRNMETPGGFIMSVAMSNCGEIGWTTDRRGYRYTAIDPLTGHAWPRMPDVFRRLAKDAAAAGGFHGFEPDACLINEYRPGTRLSLHQDKDELDYGAPIVSVSLGIPAMFLFGGETRSVKTTKIALRHGDVAVWGGVDRLRFHGVATLMESRHPLVGPRRINLTFRKAG
jgi:alkylated DNA repair protein (DNA oxidative demethylase)